MNSTTTKSSGPLEVLIVDYHDLLREGLKRVVDDEPDIVVIGEAENAVQAIAILRARVSSIALH